VTAKLRDVVEAEAELARLRAIRATALRTSEGPTADELRALDAAVAADKTRLAALEAAIIAADRAHHAVAAIVAIVEEGRGAGALWMPLLKIGVEGLGTSPSDTSIYEARLIEQVPVARTAIEQLLLRIADRTEPEVEAARRQLSTLAGRQGISTERAPLVLQASSAVTCIEQITTTVSRDRDHTRRHLFELVDQVRTLETRAR
jgi:hypothetical protein